MNIEELKKRLDREGVKPVYYSLNGINDFQDDIDVLEKKDKKWTYYHYERGEKFDLKYFDTEDEACEYIFRLLTKYPQSKIYNPQE